MQVTARRRALLPRLIAEADADLAKARARFRAGRGFRETEWNALEAAAARWRELRAAAAGAPAIRVQSGTLVPEGRAWVPAPSGSRLEPAELAALLGQTRAVRRRYRERLEALHGYDLVRHNCVSEIFRTVEAALAGSEAHADAAELQALVREQSARRLGGYVHPVASLNFIPFVSSRRVRESWSVGEQALLPSYRHHRLAAMAAREPAALVALRESNRLTARSHRASDQEGFFLFFTDGQPLARPLLGALNLGAGLLRGAFGILELPIDRGRGLRSGLTGVAFSLPELLFQSIRKGYNDYVPPDERPPPG
jgi:hypothetical protein